MSPGNAADGTNRGGTNPRTATNGSEERKRSSWVLVVAVLGTAMTIIDVTAMNVVAPTIQTDLDTDITAVQWILNGYTLFFASLMLLGGALADRFGRVRVYSAGIVLFGLASLGCALAPDAPTLIASRAFQGIGAAAMVPGALALLGATYSGRQRSHAIARWSGASAMMAAVGPVLGGVLSDYGSWRLVFLVNIPIVVALLVIIAWRIREPAQKTPAESATRIPMDPMGATLVTLAFGGITYGLIASGLRGWQHWLVLATTLGGSALLAAFLLYEHRTRHPMLPLGLFRERSFGMINLMTLFIYGALAVGMLFLPLYLIQAHGYSPTQAGFAVMPVPVAVGVGSQLMGSLIERYGDRRLLIIGTLTFAAGLGWLGMFGADPEASATLRHYFMDQFPGILLAGVGMSLIAAPTSHRVLESVETKRVGLASAVNNAASRLAALLGITVAGVLALAVFSHGLADLIDASSSLTAQQAEALWRDRSQVGALDAPGAGQSIRDGIQTIFAESYRVVQLTMAGVSILGCACAFALPRDARPSSSADRI